MSQYIAFTLKLTEDGISSLTTAASLMCLQTLESFLYYSKVLQLQVTEIQFKLIYAKKGGK